MDQLTRGPKVLGPQSLSCLMGKDRRIWAEGWQLLFSRSVIANSCDPMDCTQTSLPFTISRLLRFMSVDSGSYLTILSLWSSPLLLLSTFPSIRLLPMSQLLHPG